MARSFSKPNRLHVLNELNVTPMLDLCFVLLIIFMIATPVLEQTTAVNLPKADKGAGKAIDTKVQYRIVSLSAKGEYAVGNKPVTKAQLEAEFAAIAALPEAECRYGVYDYEYASAERGTFHRLVFVSWAPECAPIKAKMMYASTKDFFKSFCDGVGAELQATEADELDEAEIERSIREINEAIRRSSAQKKP